MRHVPTPVAAQSRHRWALASITVGLGLLGTASCQSQTGARAPNEGTKASAAASPAPMSHTANFNAEQALRLQITQTIGKATCDTSAQCRTLGLGSTPCGGPEAWVAWSTKDPASASLPALSERLAKLQRSRHEVSGMRSICRYLTDPGAMCTVGQCILTTATSTN